MWPRSRGRRLDQVAELVGTLARVTLRHVDQPNKLDGREIEVRYLDNA